MKSKVILSLFAIAFFLSPGHAQEQDVVEQQNGWYMYFGNHRLTDKWSLHTEYQWRRSDLIRQWQQSLARIGVDYRPGDQVMLTVGYGYIISYPYGDQPIRFTADEHRLWQQLVLTQRAGIFHFHHRYRLEQRWLENVKPGEDGQPVSDGRTYKNRMRYRFFTSIPLNRSSMEPGALFLAFYDEVFLGFGKNVSKKNILDQNRLYGAVGYQINPDTNLQIGYLFHQVFKDDGIRREDNHTLQVGLTYNLDFRK